MTTQPVTVRVGTMWNVQDDGTCEVLLTAGAGAVPAVPVGSIPPLGSAVVCLSTYDRLYVLGADVRTADMPRPNPPTRMSKRRDNGLRADAEGGWWVAPLRSGSTRVTVDADLQGRVVFDPPIRTSADPGGWCVIAAYGSTQPADGRVVVVGRDRDGLTVGLPGSAPGEVRRINWIVAASEGDL